MCRYHSGFAEIEGLLFERPHRLAVNLARLEEQMAHEAALAVIHITNDGNGSTRLSTAIYVRVWL